MATYGDFCLTRNSTEVRISVEGTKCVGSYTTDINSFFFDSKTFFGGSHKKMKTPEPSVPTNQNQNNKKTWPGAAHHLAHGIDQYLPPEEIKSIWRSCCCGCVHWRWSSLHSRSSNDNAQVGTPEISREARDLSTTTPKTSCDARDLSNTQH